MSVLTNAMADGMLNSEIAQFGRNIPSPPGVNRPPMPGFMSPAKENALMQSPTATRYSSKSVEWERWKTSFSEDAYDEGYC